MMKLLQPISIHDILKVLLDKIQKKIPFKRNNICFCLFTPKQYTKVKLTNEIREIGILTQTHPNAHAHKYRGIVMEKIIDST